MRKKRANPKAPGTAIIPSCTPFPLRRRARSRRVLLAVLVAALLPAFAKPAPYALIFGTVWSPEQRPVYGIRIKVRRAAEKKFRWEMVSDHNGEFALRVPAGQADYVLVPDLKGFQPSDGRKFLAPKEPILVHIENDERSDTGVHLIKAE